jgi:hypothetical protein
MQARAGNVDAAPAAGQGLAAEMMRAYRWPSRAMRRQVAFGLTEPRALFHLALACLLFFVASVPGARDAARALEIEDAVTAVLAARLFGFVFVLPLLCYALAAAMCVLARLSGHRTTGLALRSALFWSLLLGGPLALGLAALASVVPRLGGGMSGALGVAALGYWFWLLSSALAVLEDTWPARTIFIGCCTAFGGLALLAAVLT